MDARFLRAPAQMKSLRVNSVRPRNFTEADGIPDITPQDMLVLNELWNASLNGEILPSQAFIQAFTRHYAVLKPYMGKLEASHDDWVAYWTLIYRSLLDLKVASARYDMHRHYSEPFYLHWNRERAKGDMLNVQNAYALAQEDFYSEIEWRNTEISYMYKLIEAVQSAEDFDAIQKVQQERRRLENAGLEARKVSRFVATSQAAKDGALPTRRETFFSKFMSFFPCLQKNKDDVELPKAAATPEQKAEQLKKVKDDLITLYNAQIEGMQAEEDSISLKIPGDEYKRKYEKAEDESLHHRLLASREQGKEVMYHCLRLYALSVRLYYMMYGENPVDLSLDRKEPVKSSNRPIYDSSAVIISKVQDMFRQMIRGAKSNLDLFYCLQPDKVFFQDYFANFNEMQNSDDRLSFLRGDNKPEVLDKVFVEFETPEEAYNSLTTSSPRL